MTFGPSFMITVFSLNWEYFCVSLQSVQFSIEILTKKVHEIQITISHALTTQGP